MLIKYFLPEILLKVLLVSLWMNAKVWGCIWGFIGFFESHMYLYWGWMILSTMLFVTGGIMDKREALKAKKKIMGKEQ